MNKSAICTMSIASVFAFLWSVVPLNGQQLASRTNVPEGFSKGQHAPVTRKFDVATIKPANPSDLNRSLRTDPNHFSMSGFPLKSILQYAFQLPSFQILQASSRLLSLRYDIDARMDPENMTNLDTSVAARQTNELLGQQRLQSLLKERFSLEAHLEMRDLPIYALNVSKDGVKLLPSTGEQRYSTATGSIDGTDVSMKELASMLSGSVSRTVVDRTGLTDVYKLQLKWSPDVPSASPEDLPGIFTAIQQQLGLKLEPSHGSVQVLIVDRMEVPSEN